MYDAGVASEGMTDKFHSPIQVKEPNLHDDLNSKTSNCTPEQWPLCVHCLLIQREIRMLYARQGRSEKYEGGVNKTSVNNKAVTFPYVQYGFLKASKSNKTVCKNLK